LEVGYFGHDFAVQGWLDATPMVDKAILSNPIEDLAENG
jgi:hypothetical protein